MNCRRQALQFCLDSVVVVVIQIFDQFLFEVFHGLELLQIQQLTFEQPKEIFYHGVVPAEIFANASSSMVVTMLSTGRSEIV